MLGDFASAIDLTPFAHPRAGGIMGLSALPPENWIADDWSFPLRFPWLGEERRP